MLKGGFTENDILLLILCSVFRHRLYYWVLFIIPFRTFDTLCLLTKEPSIQYFWVLSSLSPRKNFHFHLLASVFVF